MGHLTRDRTKCSRAICYMEISSVKFQDLHAMYTENDIIAFIAVVPEGLYISIYQKPFNKCKITISLIRLIGVIMQMCKRINYRYK